MSKPIAIIGCIGCATFLVIMILILSSLSVLGYNEVGLNYSNWFKTVEDYSYGHGIHFIGLGHEFLRYDIKLTTIEFSKERGANMPMIKCRTKDGLELDIEASLQYRVDPAKIYDIYKTYGDYEKPILIRVITDVIHDTSVQFTSNDYFNRRQEIKLAMLKRLQKVILEDTWHVVEFFQLRSLSLPDRFEFEIQNTEVKAQDILKARKEKEREQVKYDTDVIVANLSVNGTVEQAYGLANKTIFDAEAIESTIKDVIKMQAEEYKTMQDKLGFQPKQIVGYLKANLIRDYAEGKVALQIKGGYD